MNTKNLNHFNEKGDAHMVDIGAKKISNRTATASGKIFLNKETLELILTGKSKKGDVLSVARIAAIQGCKQTSSLIPLCHQISISHVSVDFSECYSPPTIKIVVTVESQGQTGVEMEALVAVNIGLLTIYDMVKAVNRGIKFGEIGLDFKGGGQSGNWQRVESR